MSDMTSAMPGAIYSKEFEEAVVGSLFIDPAGLQEIEFLQPTDFYLDGPRLIFAAIRDLYNAGRGVDLLTVWATIEARNQQVKVGGLPAFTAMMNTVPTSMHIETYARAVQRDAVRRHALSVASDIARLALDNGVSMADMVSRLGKAVQDVQDKITHERYGVSLEAAFDDYLRNLQKKLDGGGDEVATHIPLLNFALGGGLVRGEYTVLGAPPGRGKSTLGGQMAMYAAMLKQKVLVFSNEMTPRRFAEQVVRSTLGVDTRGVKSIDDLNDFYNHIDLPITIVHEPYIKAARIPYVMRTVEQQMGGLDLVVIDHLAYINHDEGGLRMNRTQAIGITNKTIIRALEGRVACLMLTQLNREGRQPGQRPTINAFRDSGEVEQDARAILFLHADATAEARFNDIHDTQPVPLTLILAKNNAGPTMDIPIMWDRRISRMLELTK